MRPYGGEILRATLLCWCHKVSLHNAEFLPPWSGSVREQRGIQCAEGNTLRPITSRYTTTLPHLSSVISVCVVVLMASHNLDVSDRQHIVVTLTPPLVLQQCVLLPLLPAGVASTNVFSKHRRSDFLKGQQGA